MPDRNYFSDRLHPLTDSSAEFVGQHPFSTTTAAFGLGLCAGVALVYLLGPAQHHESLGAAHRLGRQVLDAISKAVPDSLAQFARG